MSKIKKMTANKKNRVEKGRREETLGSKPHSKGESVSRFFKVNSLISNVITTITSATKVQKEK